MVGGFLMRSLRWLWWGSLLETLDGIPTPHCLPVSPTMIRKPDGNSFRPVQFIPENDWGHRLFNPHNGPDILQSLMKLRIAAEILTDPATESIN